MFGSPRVLLLVCDPTERDRWQEMLAPHALLTFACNIRETQELLEASRYDAVFCAWSLCEGTWNDVLKELRHSSPDLPIIIVSRAAGEQQWVQVLEAGAFDLLGPPYREPLVLSVLEQAVASREARGWHRNIEPYKAKVS